MAAGRSAGCRSPFWDKRVNVLDCSCCLAILIHCVAYLYATNPPSTPVKNSEYPVSTRLRRVPVCRDLPASAPGLVTSSVCNGDCHVRSGTVPPAALRRYFNNAKFVCYGAFEKPDCDDGPPRGLEALLVAVNVITCATRADLISAPFRPGLPSYSRWSHANAGTL